MKKIFPIFFLIITVITFKGYSQQMIMGDVNYGLLEKYIQSAKDNYPHVKQMRVKEESAKASIASNTMSYFDIFNMSYIFRPNSATAIVLPATSGTSTSSSNPYSVNGFQFGIGFDLGAYLEKPFAGKKAKADYEAAKYDTQEYLSLLELDVKKRYYAYIQQKALLKLLTQSVADSKTIAQGVQNKFEKGDVTLDVYTQSRTNVTAATTAQLNCEVNLLLAQDSLEEIIGKKLSEIK
jgi:Outer membrane efflux protein